MFFNALVFTLRSKVELNWTRAIRPVIAQTVQFSKIGKKLNIDLCQFFFSSKYLLKRDIERRWLKEALKSTELVIILFISGYVLATPPTYVFRIYLVFTEPSIVVSFKLPELIERG